MWCFPKRKQPMKIRKDYLTTRPETRPRQRRLSTQNLVVHWSAGPGQKAKDVRQFIEGRTSFGSYTFLVDETEAIQLCELDEMTPHVGGNLKPKFVEQYEGTGYLNGYSIQNWHSIGICFTHPDWSGKPTKETYNNLVKMLVILCKTFRLGVESIVRHYDVTGKDCPMYYVVNEEKWEELKEDVDKLLQKN